MRRRILVYGLLVAAVAIGILAVMLVPGGPGPLEHETNRWAVVRDVNGDIIAVEPSRDEVWGQLVEMYENGTQLWVGGIVERYNNSWGFHFQPETVAVAEVTAEGLQATIQYISENLDYWLGGWAYVSARVTEIHLP